jgi:anti-sigma B factor antagonist
VDLSLSTRRVAGPGGDHTLVEVDGSIDVYTVPRLRERLVETLNEGSRHLVVDLKGVAFLDSAGLDELEAVLKRVHACGGSMRLVCNQERILKLFRITALTKVFSIHATVCEAVTVVE